MTARKSLAIVAIVFLLGSASFLLVLFRLNPYSAPLLSLPLFYVSSFFMLSSLSTLAGFAGRWLTRRKDEEFYNPLNVSLRQGFLLSLCVIGLLLFQAIRTLSYFDVILLVAIIVLIEVYFMAREKA